MRLCELHRRDTKLSLKYPAQVAICNAERLRQRIEAPFVEQPSFDQAGRALCQPCTRVDACITGGKLRAAAQAWSVTRRFGRGCAWKERAILLLGCLYAAYRTAINPGRGNANEKTAIEARVASLQCLITGERVEKHPAL